MNIFGSPIRLRPPRFVLQKGCACLILALFSVALRAAEPVQVYAIALDYRLNEEGTKHYNRLLKAAQEKGLNFEVTVRPLKRSHSSFKSDDSSCLFPGSIHALMANDPDYAGLKLIASDPVDYVSLRVLTNRNRKVISSTDEISGKRVAILNGMNLEQLLGHVRVELESTPSEYISLKMLEAGRLDALLSFTPDILLAAEDLGLPVPRFDEKLALLRDEGASLICRDNLVNREFVKGFNSILKNLKKSGELQRILGKYAVIAPYE